MVPASVVSASLCLQCACVIFEDSMAVQAWTGYQPQLHQCLPPDDYPEEHSHFQSSSGRQEDSAHEDSGLCFIALGISLCRLCARLHQAAFWSMTDFHAPTVVFQHHFRLQHWHVGTGHVLRTQRCASILWMSCAGSEGEAGSGRSDANHHTAQKLVSSFQMLLPGRDRHNKSSHNV